MAVVDIRPADPAEGERLREIAIAAKGYWGYDPDRLSKWAAQGDFSPEGLSSKDVFVAVVDREPVAWASLIPRGRVCWLDDLWVVPEWIRKSIGSHLFRHAVKRARHLEASRMEWEADPEAVGFYAKMGARYLRDSAETEWGRIIPVMGIDVDTGDPPAASADVRSGATTAQSSKPPTAVES